MTRLFSFLWRGHERCRHTLCAVVYGYALHASWSCVSVSVVSLSVCDDHAARRHRHRRIVARCDDDATPASAHRRVDLSPMYNILFYLLCLYPGASRVSTGANRPSLVPHLTRADDGPPADPRPFPLRADTQRGGRTSTLTCAGSGGEGQAEPDATRETRSGEESDDDV